MEKGFFLGSGNTELRGLGEDCNKNRGLNHAKLYLTFRRLNVKCDFND